MNFEFDCSLTKSRVVISDPDGAYGRAMAARMRTIEEATAAIAKLEGEAKGLRERIAGNQKVIDEQAATIARLSERKGEHA